MAPGTRRKQRLALLASGFLSVAVAGGARAEETVLDNAAGVSRSPAVA